MSYSSYDYSRTTSKPAGSFFKPTPAPEPPSTPPPSSKPTPTRRASQVKPPVSVKIVRPKGKINLVFVFDTTDSMGSARDNVKNKMQYFCGDIKNLLPELVGDMEIVIAGAGDHRDRPAMLQITAFSADVDTLKNNIESIVGTNGDDTPEGFECLFKEMNGWDIDGTNTVFILVTDSIPHGMGYGADDGCPDRVDWKTELTALKKKVRAFYLISCSDSSTIKRLQRLMVDDADHFIELGVNFIRLTNTVHGIIAKEVGEIDKYLAHLAATRGAARATEVATLLKTQQTKS